jgi:hypothetical protein
MNKRIPSLQLKHIQNKVSKFLITIGMVFGLRVVRQNNVQGIEWGHMVDTNLEEGTYSSYKKKRQSTRSTREGYGRGDGHSNQGNWNSQPSDGDLFMHWYPSKVQ